MNIVIAGGGKLGHALCSSLCAEGHNLVVIDKNAERLREITDTLDVIGVQGNGGCRSVQLEASVEKADLFIAVTDADELNILCCIVARKLGAKHAVARVRDPDYSAQLPFMKEELGLNMAINPEYAAASEIARLLRFPAAIKIDAFPKSGVQLVEFKIPENSPLDGQSLSSLYHKYQVKILVCAVERQGVLTIPGGDFVLRSGDRVNITAMPTAVYAFFKAAKILRNKAHSVLIIGGGKIAYYLAQMLIETGTQVKVIEQKESRCLALAEALPKATVICGDGSDQEVLDEEGIAGTDAFVALTGMDEENIILAMYASAKRVSKVIAKVSRDSLWGILGGVGIDTVISPKQITAGTIVQYVRAMQNTVGSNVETLYRIVGNRAEALEFKIRQGAPHLGEPLKALPLKKNMLIACLKRGTKTIFPGGNDTIELGDTVLVVTSAGKYSDFKEIFSA